MEQDTAKYYDTITDRDDLHDDEIYVIQENIFISYEEALEIAHDDRTKNYPVEGAAYTDDEWLAVIIEEGTELLAGSDGANYIADMDR